MSEVQPIDMLVYINNIFGPYSEQSKCIRSMMTENKTQTVPFSKEQLQSMLNQIESAQAQGVTLPSYCSENVTDLLTILIDNKATSEDST